MAKVTSKLQVTVPKAVADRYSIRPGDEIEWQAAGEAIRVVPRFGRKPDIRSRLRSFDQATARLAQRRGAPVRPANRGWSREELYKRGSSG
jgi:AbrB family looped-hinge helix DNA binding protein